MIVASFWGYLPLTGRDHELGRLKLPAPRLSNHVGHCKRWDPVRVIGGESVHAG